MNKLILIPALIGLGTACLGAATSAGGPQEEHRAEGREVTGKDRDIAVLFDLVQRARADVEALRALAGVSGEGGVARGEHGDGREDRGEHGEGGREGRGEHGESGEHSGREGRGEHGEGGEEGGQRLGKNERWDAVRNGARLILAYDSASQSFKGLVQNVSKETLKDVRVEVHLSSGVELGPTLRTDLKPGARVGIELSAAGRAFTWWTTHPEHGSEEGHGPGHEEGRGEHGGGGDGRPADPALRPLHNELLLLRQEIRMLAKGLQEKKRF